MTKRKHAAKPATALNPTASVAKALSPNCLHRDTSANPSAGKKAKLSGNLDKTAVSGHTAGEGLDIDDIFKQARHKKHVPIETQQVCVYRRLAKASWFCMYWLILPAFALMLSLRRGLRQAAKHQG